MAIKADSSNIETIDYDPTTKVLTIQFKNKTVYTYANVGVIDYSNLMRAPSQGQYFAKSIRGKFKAKKVQPE